MNNRVYRVLKSPKFDKKIEKILTKTEQDELRDFIEKLKAGESIGKQLSYPFLKELKFGGKRVYFLIYEEQKIILLVSASKKKYQQATIDEIKFLLPSFKAHIEKLSTQ